MEEEVWSNHPEWTKYQISDRGRVKGQKGQLMTFSRDNDGYLKVCLSKDDGSQKSLKVHVLVLQTFVGSRPNLSIDGCHNDGDRANNRLDNLRWGTKSSNSRDRVAHGNHNLKNKTHCPRGHELADWNNIASFKKRGHRACLVCARARSYFSKRKRRHGEEWTEGQLQQLSDIKYSQILAERDRSSV